jgi:hypothetical protein
VAESENTYVKIGERGRLIERVAVNARDHVNLKGTGWVLKGSKGAPTKKDETAEPPVKSGLTDATPTSQRAFADAADPGAASGTGSTGSKSRTSSSAGSAGARADAASQAAAGA